MTCLNTGCHADAYEGRYCSRLCAEEHRADLAQQQRDAHAATLPASHAHTLYATASRSRVVKRWCLSTIGEAPDLEEGDSFCDEPGCEACRRRLLPPSVPSSERVTVRPGRVAA